MTMKTLTTPAAWDLFDPERERESGRNDNYRTFDGPAGQTLMVTHVEVDEYQSETGRSLDSDVLDLGEWTALIDWLKVNAGVFDVTDSPQTLGKEYRPSAQPLNAPDVGVIAALARIIDLWEAIGRAGENEEAQRADAAFEEAIQAGRNELTKLKGGQS